MTTIPILLALPWLGLIIFEAFVARIPSELPDAPRGLLTSGDDGNTGPSAASRPPLVSVIVPARDEARNIGACLRSITASSYPSFEVIVVDDRSTDGTAKLARSEGAGRAQRLVVLDGRALPEGWVGKPWACHQGARAAGGELLLFTDSDTTHAPDLLERAIAGMREERADLLTVVGRQVMGSFWERVVQPHVFFHMLLRFPDFERVAKNDRWRDAIANGQFLLFTRSAYARIDGHRSVRDEIVEDLALAQGVKRAGLQLRIRSAEEGFSTRMYRSLGELVEGWSKNMLMGGLQSVPGPVRPVLPAISFFGGILLWLLAPAVLLGWLGGLANPGILVGYTLLRWAVAVYGLSVLMWMRFYARMGAGWPYAFLYPLAAGVFAYIFLRSWTRGTRVEWKGRRYELRSASERP